MYAPAKLIASKDRISSEFMKLTANPAQGKGGTCFGDSGGPNLQGGTDTVLAVTAFGTNANCAGVSYVNRVDIADIHDWITSFY
jgi:secreted trypsin-like serine protease